MTNPNTEPQHVETEQRQHQEAAAAVVQLASQVEVSDAALVVEQVPRRPNDSWALRGPHRGWLGFDSQTGEPKAG
jgi:hypothetical protein